jgi:hypothetical protein
MASPVFNVGWIDPRPIPEPIGGEKWYALRCHHTDGDSPLIVQLPEREWALAVEKYVQSKPLRVTTPNTDGVFRQQGPMAALSKESFEKGVAIERARCLALAEGWYGDGWQQSELRDLITGALTPIATASGGEPEQAELPKASPATPKAAV